MRRFSHPDKLNFLALFRSQLGKERWKDRKKSAASLVIDKTSLQRLIQSLQKLGKDLISIPKKQMKNQYLGCLAMVLEIGIGLQRDQVYWMLQKEYNEMREVPSEYIGKIPYIQQHIQHLLHSAANMNPYTYNAFLCSFLTLGELFGWRSSDLETSFAEYKNRQ